MSNNTKQDYVTPIWLIRLIERAFGLCFVIDLAASKENARCEYFFTKDDDALKQDWARAIQAYSSIMDLDDLVRGRRVPAAWLNPEFKQGAAFMEKAADEASKGAVIVTLTLASVGASWYRDFVSQNAESLITDRITFEGQSTVFNRDTMLTFWGLGRRGLGWQNLKRLSAMY